MSPKTESYALSIVPLYSAEERPVVESDGAVIMMDDNSFIDGYPGQHEQKDRLRFLTCGSVDHGKPNIR